MSWPPALNIVLNSTDPPLSLVRQKYHVLLDSLENSSDWDPDRDDPANLLAINSTSCQDPRFEFSDLQFDGVRLVRLPLLWMCSVYSTVAQRFAANTLNTLLFNDSLAFASLGWDLGDYPLSVATNITTTVSACLPAWCSLVDGCADDVCSAVAISSNSSQLNITAISDCIASLCNAASTVTNPDIAGVGVITSLVFQYALVLYGAVAGLLCYLRKEDCNEQEASLKDYPALFFLIGLHRAQCYVSVILVIATFSYRSAVHDGFRDNPGLTLVLYWQMLMHFTVLGLVLLLSEQWSILLSKSFFYLGFPAWSLLGFSMIYIDHTLLQSAVGAQSSPAPECGHLGFEPDFMCTGFVAIVPKPSTDFVFWFPWSVMYCYGTAAFLCYLHSWDLMHWFYIKRGNFILKGWRLFLIPVLYMLLGTPIHIGLGIKLLLNYNLVDPTWGFGQIVALGIWVPILIDSKAWRACLHTKTAQEETTQG